MQKFIVVMSLIFSFGVWAGEQSQVESEGEAEITCADYLETLSTREIISTAYLLETLMAQSQIAKPAESDLAVRKQLIADFDKVIEQLSNEVQTMKEIFDAEFGWRKHIPSTFNGERLLYERAIREMEHNILDLQRERKSALRLNGSLGLVARAKTAIRRALVLRKEVRAVKVTDQGERGEHWFLNPLNPAGPNYGRTFFNDDGED